MAAPRFVSLGNTSPRRWLPRLQWGWLALVAGAHAAGLLALSGMGGTDPARPVAAVAPVMTVRLVAPAPPAVAPLAVPLPPDDVRPAPRPQASRTAAAAKPMSRNVRHHASDASSPSGGSSKRSLAAATPNKPSARSEPEEDAPTPAPEGSGQEPPAAPAETDPPPAVAAAPSNIATEVSGSVPSAPRASASPAGAGAPAAASADAAYLDNPAPSYPRTSRRRGEEGRVVLKVRVRADGSAASVDVAERSGHPRLDEAARSAVEHWRFVPARRDGAAIDSWLDVPIVFRLDD